MENTLISTFLIIFMINGALLLGETYLVQYSSLRYHFDDNLVIGLFFNMDTNKNPTSLNSNFTGSIPTSGEKSAIQSGENTNIFIDAVSLIFNFIVLLIKLVASPLLLLALGVSLPLSFNVFFIMPLILMYVFGIIFFIRGLTG